MTLTTARARRSDAENLVRLYEALDNAKKIKDKLSVNESTGNMLLAVSFWCSNDTRYFDFEANKEEVLSFLDRHVKSLEKEIKGLEEKTYD